MLAVTRYNGITLDEPGFIADPAVKTGGKRVEPLKRDDLETGLTTRTQRRQRHERRRGSTWARGILAAMAIFTGLGIAGVALTFLTPWGRNLRMIAAETIITTRHYYLARYITTPAEYASLIHQLNIPVVNTGVSGKVKVQPIHTGSRAIDIIPIRGTTYDGFVMLVHDPRLIRLVKADVHGSMGEYITDMAKRIGAVAGTNASGFEDPNGNGWGGLAVGLEYVGGTTVNPLKGSVDWTSVGFTSSGVMVMGNYSEQQLSQLGVRDAMQFHPELVVDGKPTITVGDGGWGYGPRTAIGQTKNGTVIFVVTNGRFKGTFGPGASQRQVMDLMLHYGAVNACAMDGGSSSVLFDNGHILNHPSTIDPNHERHLPDAWMVFPTAQAASHYGL